MDESITFDRLAMVLTRPAVWDYQLERQARGLKALLRLLLTSGGFCALNRVLDAPGNWQGAEHDWLTREEAITWIDELAHRQVALARRCRQTGQGEARSGFFQQRCWIFLDHECLLHALARALDGRKGPGDEVAPDADRARQVLRLCRLTPPDITQWISRYHESGARLYLSFSVDFSGHGDSLVLTPQLVVWNYWPEDRLFAPEPPADLPERTALDPERAAATLSFFWNLVDSAFWALRECYQPSAGTQTPLQERRLSVFYFASPADGIPETPEQYLQGKWLAALQPLISGLLLSPDPLSLDVAGALLQGDLLALCREKIEPEEGIDWRSYLTLPCRVRPWEAWSELERELVLVADKLTYREIVIAQDAQELDSVLFPWAVKHYLWEDFLTRAAQVATELVREMATARLARRQQAYQWIGMLEQRLLHLGNDLTRHTADVLALPERLHEVSEATARLVRRELTTRTVPGITPLNNALAASNFYYGRLHERIDSAEKQASRLRQTFDQVIRNMAAILDQEKREAAERQERTGLRLTIAVAFLTVATILPTLVDVKLPEDMPLHNHLAELFRVFIGLTAVLTVGVICWPMVRQTWRRLRERLWPSRLTSLKERVNSLWRVVRAAGDGVSRQEREALDEQACRLLLALEQRLEALQKKAEAAGPAPLAEHVRLRHLGRQLDRLIFWSMRAVERPYPVLLPRLATLLRYKSLALFSYQGPDAQEYYRREDREFQEAWRAAGYDRDMIEWIKQWCEKNMNTLSGAQLVAELSPPQVLAKLREQDLLADEPEVAAGRR